MRLASFTIVIFICSLCFNSCKYKSSTDKSDPFGNQFDTTRKPINISAINIDKNAMLIEYANLDSKIRNIDFSQYKKEYETLATMEIIPWREYFNAAQSLDTSIILKTNPTCPQPFTIRDLTDGVSLDAYEFKKGDETKLGLMGFLNITIANEEKITVVEFSQTRTMLCENQEKKYGIGARLMLKVKNKKKGAKLDTPQQITASVVFGKAEVSYSVRTFGIIGPGTALIIRSGTLSENTYNDFINQIANVIVDAYRDKSDFIITPQYMPFKQ